MGRISAARKDEDGGRRCSRLGLWVATASLVEDGTAVTPLDDTQHDAFLDRLRADAEGTTLRESKGVHAHVKKVLKLDTKGKAQAAAKRAAAAKVVQMRSRMAKQGTAAKAVAPAKLSAKKSGSLKAMQAEADGRAMKTRADLAKAVKEVTGAPL